MILRYSEGFHRFPNISKNFTESGKNGFQEILNDFKGFLNISKYFNEFYGIPRNFKRHE